MVDLEMFTLWKIFAEGEKLEIRHDNGNFKKRNTNQKYNKHFYVPKVKFKANADHKNYDQRPRF